MTSAEPAIHNLEPKTEIDESIPEPIRKAIQLVILYAGLTDDWIRIKLELVAQTPGPYRKYFSRRHEITKLHTTNEMERKIVEYWEAATGVELTMPAVDMSKPIRARDGRPPDAYIRKRLSLLSNDELARIRQQVAERVRRKDPV